MASFPHPSKGVGDERKTELEADTQSIKECNWIQISKDHVTQ